MHFFNRIDRGSAREFGWIVTLQIGQLVERLIAIVLVESDRGVITFNSFEKSDIYRFAVVNVNRCSNERLTNTLASHIRSNTSSSIPGDFLIAANAECIQQKSHWPVLLKRNQRMLERNVFITQPLYESIERKGQINEVAFKASVPSLVGSLERTGVQAFDLVHRPDNIKRFCIWM